MLQGQRAAAAGLFPWLSGSLMEADMGDRSWWHPLPPGYELSVDPEPVCFLNSCSYGENTVGLSGTGSCSDFTANIAYKVKSESNILRGNLMAIRLLLSCSQCRSAPLN